MEVKSRFYSLVMGIPLSANIAIIHDTDADGVCSAVIIAKSLKKLGHSKIHFFHEKHKGITISDKTLGLLKKNKITYLFITDKSADQNPEIITEVEKFSTIIIFDHHQLEQDLNSENVLMIKPPMFTKISPSQYPSSKMVFDFFSEITNILETDWLAAVG